MDSDSARLANLRPYRPFLPLFFALAGWTLLHLWFHLVGANMRAHIVAACFGMLLALWSAIRRQDGDDAGADETRSTPGRSGTGAVAGVLLLLLLGAAVGMLVAQGSVLLLGMLATGANFAPWDRLPHARRHPALPCAIAGAGFAAAFLAGYDSIDVMFLPVASWALWLASLLGLTLGAVRRRRAGRAADLEPEPISVALGKK